MRRLSSFMLICCLLIAGCGDNERTNSIRQSQAEFQDAVELVNLVKREFGYSPAHGGELGSHGPKIDYKDEAIVAAMEKDNHDISAFKRAVAAQAAARLEKVKSKGLESQQVEAHRMLATLYIGEARILRRQAMVASNNLNPRLASLTTLFEGLQQADDLSSRYSNDDAPSFEKLSEFKTGNAQDLAKLNSENDALQSGINAIQAQIDAQVKLRDQLFKDSSAKAAEAFQAKGDAQFQLYKLAIDLERRGNEADIKATVLAAGSVDEDGRDMLQAKQLIVQKKIEVASAWKALIGTGIEAATGRKAKLNAFETAMDTQRDALIASIQQTFSVIEKSYDGDVVTNLDAALEQAKKGAETATQGASLASGDAKIVTNLEGLSADVLRLNIAADATVAAGHIGKVALQLEQGVSKIDSIKPSVRDAFSERVESLRDRQKQMLAEAANGAADANVLVKDDSLSGLDQDKPVEAAAHKHISAAAEILNAHSERIAEFLVPLTNGDLPEVPKGTTTVVAVAKPKTPPAGTGTPGTGTGTPPVATGEGAEVENAIRALLTGITDNKPKTAWDALPASYQKDVQDIIQLAATSVDAELAERVKVVVRKLGTLLKDKKELILGHPMVANSIPPEMKTKIEDSWSDVVQLIVLVVNSDLTDVQKLKTVDVGAFLAKDGAAIMAQLDKVMKLFPETGYATEKAAMLNVEIVVTDVTETTAGVSLAGSPPMPVVKVEGKWLPKPLVDEWKLGVEQAKASMAIVDLDANPAQKTQVVQLLTFAEGMIDNLLQAETQDQFNQYVDGIMNMVKAMTGGLGGPADGH